MRLWTQYVYRKDFLITKIEALQGNNSFHFIPGMRVTKQRPRRKPIRSLLIQTRKKEKKKKRERKRQKRRRKEEAMERENG